MKQEDIKARVDEWLNSKTPEEIYDILSKKGVIETVPKTWDQLLKSDLADNAAVEIFLTYDQNDNLIDECSAVSPIEVSALALLKIHQIIKIGYGGNVTYEEWKNGETFAIFPTEYDETFDVYRNPASFTIAFHTEEQANEFLSYPENIQLLKDFYMI